MQVLTVVQCDSMDSDDLQTIQRSILQRQGPTLGQVSSPKVPKPFVQFTSAQFIKSLPDRTGKEIKYIGNSEQSIFRAYYYILLHIDLQQRRFYPHLRSIIKQQLNKDYILRREQQDDQILKKSKDNRINPFSNRMRKDSRDKVCDMYFQIVHNYTKIQDFIMRNPRFDGTCMHMIMTLINDKNKYLPAVQIENSNEDENTIRDRASNRKSDRNDRNSDTVSKQSKKSTKSTKSVTRSFSQDFKFLCKVYNIDFQIVKEQKTGFTAYRIGSSKKFFIINQSGHIFVVLLGLLMGNSGRKNSNHESQIVSNASTPLLPQVRQASEQSTPKFIEGHESSIRYRKKSHKNSFGGDVQIVSYKDLNASFHQLRASKDKRDIEKIIIENSKKKLEKVFSQRFEAQQMGDLQQLQAEQQGSKKKTSSKKDKDGQKQQQSSNKSPKKNIVGTKPMRKSHCQTVLVSFQSFLQQRGKNGQDKGRRQESNSKSKKLQQSKMSNNSTRKKKKLSNSACLEAEEAEKLAVFNNKVSFSKHDRLKFELGSQQPPERQQESLYNQSNGINQGFPQNRNQRLNNHNRHTSNFENSPKNLEKMVLGINRNIIDSRIQELPQEQFDKSRGSASAQETNKQFKDGHYYANTHGMTNEAIIQMLQPSVREKLQNRKFSYVSHNKFSARENQLRELNKSEKKNTSQDIIWQKSEIEKSKFENRKPQVRQKQRFEQNHFTMSDLDRSNSTNPAPPPISNQRFKSKMSQIGRCKLVSQVVQFVYESNAQAEPAGWIRKEVVYFFADRAPQRKVMVPVRKNASYNRNLARSTDRKNRPYLYNLVQGRVQMKKSINQFPSNRHQRHSLADPVDHLFQVRSNESHSAKKVIQMARKVLSPPIQSANTNINNLFSNNQMFYKSGQKFMNLNGNSGHTNNTSNTINAFNQNGYQSFLNQSEQWNRRKASVSLSAYSNMAIHDAKLYHKTRKNTTSNNFINVIRESANQQNGLNQRLGHSSPHQTQNLISNVINSGRKHQKASNTLEEKSSSRDQSITNNKQPNQNPQNKFRPYPNLPINSPIKNTDNSQRYPIGSPNAQYANRNSFVLPIQSYKNIPTQATNVNRVYNATSNQTIQNLQQQKRVSYVFNNKTNVSQVQTMFIYSNEKVNERERSQSPNTQNNSQQPNNRDSSNKNPINYSTSLEHLVLPVSPKINQNITMKTQLQGKGNNPQSRVKPHSTNNIQNYVYQPRTHRGSINFVISSSPSKRVDSKQVRRISPQQSNTSNSNNTSGLSNKINQPKKNTTAAIDGIRPPSNTATVSSKSNTNRENSNYIYYKR